MLLQFIVGNYRSVRAQIELSMRASDDIATLYGREDHASLAITNEFSALRCAAIYGANASGKSNLISALLAMRTMILEGDIRHHFRPFRLDDESPKQPSRLEIYILIHDTIYGYGFSFTRDSVTEEELTAIENNEEHPLFIRRGSNFIFSERLKTTKDPKFIEFLGEGTPRHRLFLSEAKERNLNFGPISAVIEWFSECLKIIQPTSQHLPLIERIESDSGFRSFLANELVFADTGITGLSTRRRTLASEREDEFNALPKESQLRHLLAAIRAMHPRRETVLETDDGSLEVVTLLAQHEPKDAPPVTFGFEDESDGTRRYLDLVPMTYFASKGTTVFVVDELDRSLHTLLAQSLIEKFLSISPTSQSQLIFSTHDTNLLNCKILRPDCIWFTEKDPCNATTLFSLADFPSEQIKVLSKDLEKGYLRGRFGGIPFLGDPKKLGWIPKKDGEQ